MDDQPEASSLESDDLDEIVAALEDAWTAAR